MQDFIYVGCDNGASVPMRPVKWDKRIAGDPNTLVSGGKKDMCHITKPTRLHRDEDTFPVAISVMGQMWTLNLSWSAECDRIELHHRRELADKRAIRAAQEAEDKEYENYSAYHMSRVFAL